MKFNVISPLLLLVCYLCAFCVQSQSIEGTWSGVLDVKGQTLSIVIHIHGDSATLDSPDQNAAGIPAVIDYNREGRLRLSVPKIMAMYNAKLDGDTLRGKFKQGLTTTPLSMTQKELVRNRPQTPTPPYPYQTEEIAFYSRVDSARLEGTLTMATEADAPLVVMVSGSGQQNRDSEILGHKPFAVIADYFARNGISTFRYDDRGVGSSERLNEDFTHFLEAEDTRSALQAMKDRGLASRYGILGHSLGGEIAYMIAGEHPDEVDFIISMAGSAERGDTIMIRQSMQAAPTVTREECAEALKQATETGPWHQWLKAFAEYDPAEAIAKIECPVMAVNGSLDRQVDADSTISRLKANLKIKPQDKIKVYPGLNHLFQHTQTGYTTEYGQIEETISPEVLSDIAAWIKGL